MLRKGLPAKLANTDAGDTRYDFRNFVTCNADGTARGGVTSPVGSVLSSTATMNVTVGAFSGIAARDGGVVTLSSDGPVSVLLNAAPSANSRIDVITARQNDSSSTVSTPDGSDTPQFIVLQGTAAATPVRPTVPDGSLDLGSVLIPSTATATNSAGVVISPPAQFTAAAGAAVPFSSKAALDLWATAAVGQKARVFGDAAAKNVEYVRTASVWSPILLGGTATVPATGTTTFAFPAPFDAAPVVVAAVSSAANVSIPWVTGVTASGVQLRIFTTAAAQIGGTVDWVATRRSS